MKAKLPVRRRARRLQVETLEDRRLLAAVALQDKLYAGDINAANDRYGTSVAVDGDWAAVAGAGGTGAYLYQRFDPGTPANTADDLWLLQKKLAIAIPSSVAISNETVVIGASDDHTNANFAGAVLVYSRNQGGADNWGLVKKITADAAAQDQFGTSVAIHGDYLAVGSPYDDDAGTDTGSTYVFQRNQGGADNWGEVKKLTASAAGTNDRFGSAVAITAETLLVGAPYRDVSSVSDAGTAYVFARDQGGANNWGQTAVSTASVLSNSAYYGYRVSVDGARAVVGAPQDNNYYGAAYLLGQNQGGANAWGQVKKLTASDAAYNDWFGGSVGLDGDTVVVAALYDDDRGSSSGSAYLFERHQGGADNWGQSHKLTASDGAAGDRFGWSVAVAGDAVLAASPYDGEGGSEAGSVYAFDRHAGGAHQFGQTRKLTATAADADDEFGSSLAMEAGWLVVGAPEYNGGQGAAHVFRRDDGGTPVDYTDDRWFFTRTLYTTSVDSNAGLGHAVAVSGNRIVVGAPRDGSNNSGAAVIFEQNQGGTNNWGFVKKITATDAAADDRFGSSVGFSGDTLVVGAELGDAGVANTGAAYVFARNQGGTNNWGQVTKLTASNAAANDAFGRAVAIDGDTIAVGAPLGDDTVADVGAVYLFERNSGGANAWGEVRRTTAADAGAGTTLREFAAVLALDGDTLLVGAPLDDETATDAGAAFLFERDLGGADNWGQRLKLLNAAGGAGDELGYGVAIADDTVVLGSPNAGGGGTTYVFERDRGGANAWGELTSVTAPDGAADDAFGRAVAVAGSQIAVGAPLDDDGGANAGSVYGFQMVPDVSVGVSPAAVSEDGGANFAFTFTRTGPVDAPLVVEFAVSGTATYKTDYTVSGADAFQATSGTAIIPTGQSSVTLIVSSVADPTVETDETVLLTLAADANYQIGAAGDAAGVILNDDDVHLVVSPAAVAEDGAGNLVYTFTRANTAGTLTVNFDIGGSAALGTDYTQSGADAFDGVTGSITFPNGAATVNLTIDPTPDTLVELDETVVLSLAAGTGYTISIPTDVSGTIQNDETATIRVSNVSQAESDAGTTFTFEVTLEGVVDHAVTAFANTVDGTAFAGQDYTAVVDQSVVFPAHTATPQVKTVNVTVTGDTVVELDEAFFLTVGQIQAGGREIVLEESLATVARKLNNDLVGNEQVNSFILSENRAIFQVYDTNSSKQKLFSASLYSGAAQFLGESSTYEGLTSQVTPDGATVIYRTDQDTAFMRELYSVPVDGGTPTKLNGALPAGGDVADFTISPDGATVVYRADQDADEVYELYSVPVDGGAPTKLNGSLVSGGDVSSFQISPDGATVVYYADQDSDNVYELYSVPMDGGTPTKLNGSLVSGGNVSSFAISPDGATVVYYADQDTNDVYELYSVPVDGGGPTKLNGALVSGGDVSSFHISPDGATVVYRANQDASNVYELYSVPVDGGTPTKLNGSLVSGGNVSSFAISPDGATVVYYADQDTNDIYELYSVPVDGGAPTKLNGALVSGGAVSSFQISPDGATVVYRADQDFDNVYELYSVPVDGGAPTKLNGSLVAGGDVSSFAISPDGATVVYQADQDADNVYDLYRVPVDGGTPVKVTGAFPAYGGVSSYQIHSDGMVVYVANPNYYQELFAALPAAQGTILNDDTATVTVGNASASEALGTIQFTVTLNGQVDTPFHVSYQTADGTATANSDYTPSTSGDESAPDLYFSGEDGDTETVVISIATDNVVELNETFLLELLSIDAGGRTGIALVDGTGTILNDDTATLSITSASVTEGNSGSQMMDFVVKLTGFVQGGVEVPYATVDGTAKTSDSDYTSAAGTLSFTGANFVESHAISVPILGDAKVELDEFFRVALGTLAASQADVDAFNVVGHPATGTIVNNDSATLTINDVTAPEGQSGQKPFTFTATLSNPVDEGVIVAFQVNEGTATFADSDLGTTGGSFGIPAGQTSGTFSVLVGGDRRIEAQETFTAQVTTLQAGGRGVNVSDGIGQGAIQNDDVAGFTIVESGGGTAMAGAGAADSFTVVLNAQPNSDVVIDLHSSDADQVAVAPWSLIFSPANWDTPQTVTVTHVAGDEPVTLMLDVNDGLSDGHFALLADQAVNVVHRSFQADNIGTARMINGQYYWYLDANGTGKWDGAVPGGDLVFGPFGVTGDIPISGDWNGDGKDEIGVVRTSSAGFRWLLDTNGNGQFGGGDQNLGPFGGPGDTPLVGDWNGDGKDEIGVSRAINGRRFIYLDVNGNGRYSASGDLFLGAYGYATDRPVIGDWDGDGDDQVGMYRPSTRLFLLDVNGDGQWSGGIDQVKGPLGGAGAQPITGAWSGNATGKLGVFESGFWRLDLDNNGVLDSQDANHRFGRADDALIVGNWSIPMLAAGGEIHRTGTESLRDPTLAPLVDQAMAWWRNTGLSHVQQTLIAGVRVAIADLPGAELGSTGGRSITLDIDAAGHGWFVDPTPARDEEFNFRGGDERTAIPGSAAEDRMDLLSVVLHELGHILGHGHDDDDMLETLAVGMRQFPRAVDAVFGKHGE